MADLDVPQQGGSRRRGTLGGLRRAAGLLALLLLVAGCQARLSIELAVDADGAGSLTVGLVADPELLQQARAAGADPLTDLASTGASLEAAGWRTVDVTDADGWRTVTLSTAFADPDELDVLARALIEGLAAPELAPLRALTLEMADDVVRVSGSAGLEPTAAVTELGVQPDQAVEIMRAGDHLAYELSVVLPGEVLETNGELHDGGRVTWAVAPGERVELLAVGDRPRGSWLLLVGAGAAAGLAALALLGLTARRHGAHAAQR